MPDPLNVAELRRVLGMINFLGRYLPNLSQILRPVTELLEKNKVWLWDEPQKEALKTAKELLSKAPTLAYYDLSKPTIVSADASSYGLGAVLLQQDKEKLRPVAYCSRTLSAAEKGFAQVEKECLAAIWACEKFERYLIGLPNFKLQTDHKPLVPLLNSKDLQDAPIRCQRMLIRFMRFNVTAEYTPGKDLVVADALSRSPINVESNSELQEEIGAYVGSITSSWPISDQRLNDVVNESQKDDVIRAALQYTAVGWPRYIQDVKPELRDLFGIRNELSIHKVKGLLYPLQREPLHLNGFTKVILESLNAPQFLLY